MNRHQRRAQKAHDTMGAWRRGIETVHREAAGVLELIVVRPETMLDLVVASCSGDLRARAIARAALNAVCDISKAAKRGTPKLCGSCPHDLNDNRYAVVLAAPQRDDPSTAIAMAICEECATIELGIREKATEGFRRLWPNLRPITVTHQDGGRA